MPVLLQALLQVLKELVIQIVVICSAVAVFATCIYGISEYPVLFLSSFCVGILLFVVCDRAIAISDKMERDKLTEKRLREGYPIENETSN